MKKTTLVVVSLLMTQLSLADSQVVPSDQWVIVVNDSPVESSNNKFKFGEDCVIRASGVVEEISRNTKDVLVRYSAPSYTGGTLCPTGTGTLIDVKAFELMSIENEELKAKKSNFKDYVKSLRSKS